MNHLGIIALDDNKNTVSIDDFFSKYKEFSENYKLIEQTSRFLKVLLRHHELETVKKIADQVENGYSFRVSGSRRTYIIVFEIKNDEIVLKKLQ